jgi:hypothetical protein
VDEYVSLLSSLHGQVKGILDGKRKPANDAITIPTPTRTDRGDSSRRLLAEQPQKGTSLTKARLLYYTIFPDSVLVLGMP